MFKNDKGRTVYVDTKSIVKKGGHVFYSLLTNLSVQQGFEINNVSYRWLSYILYIKVDCSYFRYKILRKRFFERPTGNGRVTYIDNKEQKWVFLTTKSYFFKPFNFSCKYAKGMK